MNWSNTRTNYHWFWVWPFGFFITLFIALGLSRLFWWRGPGRRGNGTVWQSSSRVDAQEILKQQYAKGDITKEEYMKVKQDLEK